MIFTLCCDIFDQAWSLLKYWENVNFDFTINVNFAFRIEIKKCNSITHMPFIFVENLKMI